MKTKAFLLVLLASAWFQITRAQQSLSEKPAVWQAHESWKDSLLRFYDGRYSMRIYDFGQESGTVIITLEDQYKHWLKLEMFAGDRPAADAPVKTIYLSGYQPDIIKFYQYFTGVMPGKPKELVRKGAYQVKVMEEYTECWRMEMSAVQ